MFLDQYGLSWLEPVLIAAAVVFVVDLIGNILLVQQSLRERSGDGHPVRVAFRRAYVLWVRRHFRERQRHAERQCSG